MVAVGSSVAAAAMLVSYPIAGGQALRYAAVGVLLLVFARRRLPRLTRSQAARLIALAANGLAAFNAFLIASVRHADAGSVGVIVGCVPVVLALAGPLSERRPVRPRVVAAAAVVSLGAAAVQGAGGSMSLAGFAFSLGALACEAAFTLLAIPLIASLGPRTVSAYACLLAVPLLIVTGVVVDGRDAIPIASPEEAAALAYMAVVVTALAFVLWYSSVGRLGVERAGLFAGIDPVSALLSAAAIGESTFTLVRLLGATAVAAGVSLGLTTKRSTDKAAAVNDMSSTPGRTGRTGLAGRDRRGRVRTASERAPAERAAARSAARPVETVVIPSFLSGVLSPLSRPRAPALRPVAERRARAPPRFLLAVERSVTDGRQIGT